jgi:hypothetical protein
MISLLFAAALSASSNGGCDLGLARGEAIVERRVLRGPNGALQAVALSRSDENDDALDSRMLIIGSNCRVMFSQRFVDAKRVLFTEGRLGVQPILFVTGFTPGGSGCGYQHTILAYGGEIFPEDGVQPIAPMLLTRSNMDGIFVGDLGRGRGPGLVVWSAQWNSRESHYEPHHYEIVSYLWRNGRFIGPNVRTTRRKYDPDYPNAVVKNLGFTFRDLTPRSLLGGC